MDKDGQEWGWGVTTAVSQKAVGLALTRALFSIKISIIRNIKLQFRGEKTELKTYLLLKNKQVQEKQSGIGHSPYPRRPKQFWDRWLPSFNPNFSRHFKNKQKEWKGKVPFFLPRLLRVSRNLRNGPTWPRDTPGTDSRKLSLHCCVGSNSVTLASQVPGIHRSVGSQLSQEGKGAFSTMVRKASRKVT